MMLKRIAVMGAISLVSLAACQAGAAESNELPATQPADESARTSIRSTPSDPVTPTRIKVGDTVLEIDISFPNVVLPADEKIDFVVRATNVGPNRVGLHIPEWIVFPTIVDGQGSTVWPPEFRGMILAHLPPGTEFELDPGASHEWTLTWDLTNQNGDRVWPGDYQIHLDADRTGFNSSLKGLVTEKYPLRIEG